MNILAIDLGKYNSMCCFFDSCSREYEFCNTQTTRGYLEKFLAGRQIDLVVMEACGPSGWVSELCQQLGYPTLVCSTNEEAWRWKNVKRKTDKDDALKLARMAMMGELTPVHIPKHEVREHRTLVKYRKTLDRRINQIKNSIRSLFSNRGIGIASGARAWHTGRERIDSFRRPLAECSMNELWRGQLNEELKQLDALTAQLANVEARLEVIAKSDPRIQRLQTIPGVGRKTAEALVTTLDDVHRFKNSRQVSAYLGLVPKQYQSGQTNRHGRITKRGSALVRTVLLECAWVSLRYNPWARATYDRIHGGQRTRKKKAAIALARKIAVVGWAMLKHETNWDPTKMTIPELTLVPANP
ncbi:MAG: IS110 family transposase [Planctomycetota bacterium]